MYADNPTTQTLLALGKPKIFSRDPWPDYVNLYSLTIDDVPALLALFADETVDTLPQDSPEIWAPVHAWRALGQLRSEGAIEPFITSFDRLREDDVSLTELPKAIGMIGAAAIPALAQHMQQFDTNEFSRMMAVDALCEIALRHPANRDPVLAIYRAYLTAPDTAAFELNGILLGRLLDLNATEAIEEIRQLFARDCVNLSCVGDLEDVEVGLGLRESRETPRPNYARREMRKELLARLADGFEQDLDKGVDPVYACIDRYLLLYGSDIAISGVSELDGFFAALACAPISISASTWLPTMWGGDQQMPAWEHATELREFTTALLQHYNQVMGDFQADDYEPLFLESTVLAAELLVVNDWCAGFLRGLALWGPLSPEDTALLDQWLLPVRCFTIEQEVAAMLKMTVAEMVQMQQRIQPSVVNIRRHFFKPVKRADTTFVHASPKVGRNDPCPCGSGKKHKKCCGLH